MQDNSVKQNIPSKASRHRWLFLPKIWNPREGGAVNTLSIDIKAWDIPSIEPS